MLRRSFSPFLCAAATTASSSLSSSSSTTEGNNNKKKPSKFQTLENQDVSGLEPEGKLVRGFRIDQVANKVALTDYVYALQSAKNLFTFISKRGATSEEVAKSILEINSDDRCCHAVFGRPKVPCDFYADIEFPTYQRLRENVKMRQDLSSKSPEEAAKAEEMYRAALGRANKKYTGEEILIDVVRASTALLQEKFKYKPDMIAIFDGGATEDKHSYHLHMRCKDKAFADYNCLADFFGEVNSAVGIEAVDPACCRYNGMLRMGFTPKFSEKSRVMTPLSVKKVKDKELKNIIKPMQDMTDVQLLAMTLVSRLDEAKAGKVSDGSFKLISGAGARNKQRREYDQNGRVIQHHMLDDKKQARFKEVCNRVHALPLHLADDYNTWIRVGLSLHSFGPDNQAFQQWVQFSSKVPSKFDPKVCEKYWNIFARRPDCYNWRRGYLYIMKTLSAMTKGQKPSSTKATFGRFSIV